ncbi:hypothetical protein O6H91_06G061000 [Diphasiastrum complanatum]|uniref:Uncharacterized protein n=1 Tax=Diphasiastrum complanatum TaxID=34168 RepID=A0ACC2DF47_DIPCM|nr:hypothetical protein O6H91_06G061000 [Diphasiastrum complanatum]
MAGRLPLGIHYNLNAGSSLVGNALHDLNTVDSRNGDIEGITDTERDPTTGDSLDNEEDSTSGDCGPQTFGSSLHEIADVETDPSISLENEENPGCPYGVLSYKDVMPIETARVRFLQLIVEHFVQAHLITVQSDSSDANYVSSSNKEKENKRKKSEVQFEGDARFLLPLTYIANLYETLVHEVDARLASVEGIHEKTIGVALEASGGLYRRLMQKYPKSGGPMIFKRREMASALEARSKFPQLVIGDQKRIRFVVIHGLELKEHPRLSHEDAEWFKRLTGRHEALISERDYKFHCARAKHRRAPQHGLSSLPVLQPYANAEPLHSVTDTAHHLQYQNAELASEPMHSPHQHQAQQTSRIPHAPHPQHASHTSHLAHVTSHSPRAAHTPHIAREMQSPGLHTGLGMLVVTPPSPAKYCDACGAQFIRQNAKYCYACGTKRLMI